MIALPLSVQKLLGNDENISSDSPRSKGRLIRSTPDDLIGQLEIVETLPELDKLLLSLPVELFLGLLVAMTKCIALGEERGH